MMLDESGGEPQIIHAKLLWHAIAQLFFISTCRALLYVPVENEIQFLNLHKLLLTEGLIVVAFLCALGMMVSISRSAVEIWRERHQNPERRALLILTSLAVSVLLLAVWLMIFLNVERARAVGISRPPFGGTLALASKPIRQ